MPKVPSPRKVTSPSKNAQREGVERRKRENKEAKEKDKREKERKKQEEAERKEEWQKYVTNNQWRGPTSYVHREGERTIAKTHATKLTKPQLKSDELCTLPHEIRPVRPTGKDFDVPMKLYSYSDVKRLAELRAQTLRIDLVWTADLESRWNESVLIRKREYTRVSPDDPSVNEIIWKGEHLWSFGVNVDDACLTYCLEPYDVADLVSKNDWLDLKSVAVRALEIHEGLKRHNEIVVNKRKADKNTVEASYQSLKGYSRGLRQFLDNLHEEASQYYPDHDPRRPTKEERRRTVLQYGPVWMQCEDDHCTEWVWYHGNDRLLEDDDLVLPSY
ncbi:hypothetical protein VNI00_005973 [Paramarasmius palmivorus]|uniref:Uncharacterized protein n=1 Tax=Paramarasmius palmivorus TaxID=297713 RepID=A0AAW0DE91_9AGAR